MMIRAKIRNRRGRGRDRRDQTKGDKRGRSETTRISSR